MTERHGPTLERLLTATSEPAVCQAGRDLLDGLFRSPASIYSLGRNDQLEIRSTTATTVDEALLSIPLSSRILERTAQLRRSARIDDCSNTRASGAPDVDATAPMPDADGAGTADPATSRYRSILLVPIPDWGMLVVTDQAPGVFDDRDLALADLVAALLETKLNQIGSSGYVEGSSPPRASSDPKSPDDRLETIASVLSHDLSSPLTVARGYVQDAIDRDETENLEDVLLALDRIEELTGGVEEVARTGQVVSDPRPVELREAAEVGWSIVEPDGARLVTERSETILADGHALYQLFENLFANAVQHGGENVTVRVGTFEDGSGFYVEDDGPGIPPEQREVVFEHGYSGTDDQSGFGLSIVDGIVDGHGWEICVLGGAEGGTRVEISGVRPP